MARTRETYVSVDVETDGPIPGPHSMLSLGAAAFTADGTRHGTFSANLDTLEGATGHPETMAWWAGQPEAWEACRASPEAPAEVMARFRAWVEALPGRPVFVAYPAGFDFTFVYWYLHRFTGGSPFGFGAIDVKTYAMAALGRPYRDCVKGALPRAWIPERPHTHVALDDALEQGELFLAMLRAKGMP
ncbi:MAG: 3'-5' exoribonuclease [Myxococcota bacterium]